MSKAGSPRKRRLTLDDATPTLMINYKYGYGAAVSVIMMLVTLIPAILYIRHTVRHENSVLL